MEEAKRDNEVNFDEFLEVRKLRSAFGEAIEDISYDKDELSVRVKKDFIVDVCKFLRDDEELKYNYLSDITAVHYPKREKPFEVVYHLVSVPETRMLRIKVWLSEDEEIYSVYDVWPSASWFEREVYDMFGIVFKNHPDLRRILLPEDWEGHPLRKDYPLQGPPGYREKWLKEHLVYTNKL